MNALSSDTRRSGRWQKGCKTKCTSIHRVLRSTEKTATSVSWSWSSLSATNTLQLLQDLQSSSGSSGDDCGFRYKLYILHIDIKFDLKWPYTLTINPHLSTHLSYSIILWNWCWPVWRVLDLHPCWFLQLWSGFIFHLWWSFVCCFRPMSAARSVVFVFQLRATPLFSVHVRTTCR